MTKPIAPTPGLDATALLHDVRQQSLRGMVWAIAGYCPVQLLLWHSRPIASRSEISLLFEIILVVGVALQFLALKRLTIAGSGLLFVTWLGLIDGLAWVTTGPQLPSGVAMVCTILVAVFFVGKRAGVAVLLGFAALVVGHALLVGQGLLAPYPMLPGKIPATVGGLLQIGLLSLAILSVCFACFATVHHAFLRAVDQAEAERQSRAAAEATMRANQHFEALGKLTSGVAHDVNNALTSVLGNAELLKMSLPEGEQQTFAADIINAARSAAHTTRHLLSLNRHAFCQPVSLDPAETARSVSRLVGRLMPDNIRLSLETSGTRRILVDPSDLQQALLNLLLNARDALPAGGTVRLRTEDGPGPGVTVTVADNGNGIPAEVLPRIFDPFFTTKAEGQGTGLGLAMVRAFVEESGGTVTAQNDPAGGACFRLTFPECLLPVEPATEGLAAPPDTAGRRILLIEDQTDLRALMDRVLTRGGHRVTAAGSATEAITLLGIQEFDLLCTDGIFGPVPVARVIAEYRRKKPLAPVLLCSGHADQELAGGGFAALRADLLRKPFTGTELLACVRRTLQAAASGRTARETIP